MKPIPKSRSGRIAASVLLALAPLAPLHGAGGEPVIAPALRQTESARPVAVLVPQTQIENSVEIGRVAINGYGGLLGTLIITEIEHGRRTMTRNAEDRAASLTQPLVEALDGFDVKALALGTTRRSMASLDWFGPGTIALVPGDQGSNLADFAAANPAEQTGLASFRYQLSADFSQMQVIVELQLARGRNLQALYRQQVVSIVRLDRPSYDFAENIATWSADDASLARRALTAAFARLEQVIPVVMAMDRDAYRLATDSHRPAVVAAGYHGPLVFRDASGPVLWDDDVGFIAVVTTASLTH